MRSFILLAGLAASALAQSYSATYLPSNAPATSEDGQEGTNKCGTGSNQTSMCQNAYLNSVDDFCLFAPPNPGANSEIGETERFEVSWCMKSGYGTRLIPDGTMQGVHFVKTPDYVQITGVGDLTKLNIPKGDAGGELDPHGADGNGNPIGGLVFSSAFGQLAQLHEWTNFMSDSEFCFRGCKDGPNAPALCMHIYDVMGCDWNMPGNYAPGVFEQCVGDTGEPMGVYGGSTFHQGDPVTPAPHPAPSSSQCTTTSTIGNGQLAVNSTTSSSSSAATTTVSTSSSSLTSPTSPNPGSGASSEPTPSVTSGLTTSHSSTTSAKTSGTPSATSNAGFARFDATALGGSTTFAVAMTIIGSLIGGILLV